jgi:hypothetical protein
LSRFIPEDGVAAAALAEEVGGLLARVEREYDQSQEGQGLAAGAGFALLLAPFPEHFPKRQRETAMPTVL